MKAVKEMPENLSLISEQDVNRGEIVIEGHILKQYEAPPVSSMEQATKFRHEVVQEYEKGSMYRVRLSDILIPDKGIREGTPESLKELEMSLKSHGMLQPMIVKLNQGILELVAGGRRYQAASNIGMETAPCLVIEGNAEEIALIENILRENLTPVEEAEQMQQILDKYGYTHEILADVLGKSRSTVSETLSINRIPKKIRDECRKNPKYSRRDLLRIAKKPDEKAMIEAYNNIKSNKSADDDSQEAGKGQRREYITLMTDSIKNLKKRVQRYLIEDRSDEDKKILYDTLQDMVKSLQKQLKPAQKKEEAPKTD